jgi:endonuclease/exonuclease/phosphatase (EEP) superfamily protein YafD
LSAVEAAVATTVGTSTRGPLLRIARTGAHAFLACGVLASLFVWSASFFWLGEIGASLAWYLGLVLFAAAPLALVVSARFASVALLLLGFAHAGPELWLFVPDGRAGPAPDAGGDTLVLASCNLLFGNPDHEGLRELLAHEEPDVVVCTEVSRSWKRTLDGLDAYPHRFYSPPPETWNRETWGTAILSRRPFARTALVPVPSGASRPIMEAVVPLDDHAVTVRGAHPMRPGKPWRLALRDEVLAVLGELEWDAFGVVAGDLNVTSTSPRFRALLRESGLRDSRLGFGRQPTFALLDPRLGPWVAIDHVAVGDGLRVEERRTVVLGGSDHRAVVVRLGLAAL